MTDLFSPITAGLIFASVVMPMTRNRAEEGNAPYSLNATYYKQRSDAALIITKRRRYARKEWAIREHPASILKANRWLAGSDGRSARNGRTDYPAALHVDVFRIRFAAGWYRTGCTVRHTTGGRGDDAVGYEAVCDAASAGNR